MLVKNRREESHLEDLRETFDTLRSYNMKLNPGKCAFKVTAGKLLGFFGVSEGYRGQPRQDLGHNGDGTLEEYERSTKPQWQNSSLKQVHVKGNRQVSTFLSHAEEIF